MKVLLLNGSTRKNGCTYTALSEISTVLHAERIETEILQMGARPVRDCAGCGQCVGKGKCAFEDDMANDWIEKARESDGFVFGSPVYYAHPTGQMLSLLDRMFYAAGDAFSHKPGAAVLSARRGGTAASFDVLNKYFTIAQMPVVSSTYWNMVYGRTPDEVRQDLEGLQTMRNIGRNMAWLLKSIQAGREQGLGLPQTERTIRTNFIR